MRPSVAAAATRRLSAADSHVPLSDALEKRVAARNQSRSPRERQVTKQLSAQAVARVQALEKEATRRALLESFGGICWWCWKTGGPGCPIKCELKEQPDMSDFIQEAVPSAKTRYGGRGKRKTMRSPEEQAEHRMRYKKTRLVLARRLETDAKERLTLHFNTVNEPLRGIGACGQFTVAQVVLFEYVLALPELMSKEQLSKPQSTINAAALQVALGIVLCS